MSLLTLIALAVALGADAFSLCLALGMNGVRMFQVWLISGTVLVFHIIMPLIGFSIGDLAGKYIGQIASILGALILLYLGGKMIWEACKKKEEEPRIALLNTWGLLVLAFSVSLDALSVGFTLGTRNVNLPTAVLLFGLLAGLMTFSGLMLGKFIGRLIGNKAEILGGIVLVIIGIKLFF